LQRLRLERRREIRAAVSTKHVPQEYIATIEDREKRVISVSRTAV